MNAVAGGGGVRLFFTFYKKHPVEGVNGLGIPYTTNFVLN